MGKNRYVTIPEEEYLRLLENSRELERQRKRQREYRQNRRAAGKDPKEMPRSRKKSTPLAA